MPKYSSLRAIAAAALAVLCACTHAQSSAAARDSLVIGRVGDLDSLDPLMLSGSDSESIGPLVFSYLITVDSRGVLAPDVAQAVPSVANGGISPDGKTVVYRLRKGVRWQDGAPLTSRDVAFTYQQVMNPRNNVPERDVYDTIVRLETPDPWTVRLTLRDPNSAVLSYFFAPDGNYTILPEHLLRGRSDLNHAPFNAMPVGSGPFRVVEWRHGDRLRLERFDGYFGGTPPLREITVESLASAETLLLQMQTHEIDATFAGSVTRLADFAKIPGVRAVRSPEYGAALLAFNAGDPMVSDVRVRRAIVEAADLARIVQQASRGALTTADAGRGFYGPDYDPSIASGLRDDFADANRLFDETGWTRNAQGVRQRNGVALAPAFVYIQSSPEAAAFAVLLQARLQRAGVALTLRPYPQQVYGAPAGAGGPILGGKFQIVLLQLLAAIDPSTQYFLGCDQFPPRGANYTRYCNAAIDRANAASLRAYDPKERAADSATVQRIVARDLPFVPLWQQANTAAYPSDLEGVYPGAFLILGNVATWRLRRR
ncbi:MAG TPA: peptide ABC transporter substrate-binding protein [Candidatus Acidoferrales bacterium]|jgi:peptide/nickel transport system substrate-binding protein|nr:peptide ABC transporter substrate-binding protein [Candidatus Acidoferrales bacterium]